MGHGFLINPIPRVLDIVVIIDLLASILVPHSCSYLLVHVQDSYGALLGSITHSVAQQAHILTKMQVDDRSEKV
jgi:uncharacterized membrane protein YadS